MLETMRQDAERIRAWGRVLGSWGDADARNGVAELDTDYRGLIAGMDFGTPLFRFGFAAGLSGSDYDVDGRSSKADVESQFLGAQASYAAGAFRAGLGATYAWHDVDTTRAVGFADVSQSLASDTDATTFQLFGELSYSLDLGGFGVMPFARLAHVRTETDDFAETGGGASLAVAEAEQETNFLALGVEARANQDGVFQPRLSLAWQHGWGDLTPAIRAGFASGGPTFTVVGTKIPENAALIDAGFDVELDRFRIGAGYIGSLSDKWSDHGAQATVTFAF
jgi:outer membrane autotransporter protein